MPIYKPQLTRSEQARYLKVALELAAAGVKLDIPDEWRENNASCASRLPAPRKA